MMRNILYVLISLVGLNSPALADKALFAGGCFWCMESDFQDVQGVTDVVSGYTGGHLANPSYKQVTYGATGHYEAVEVTFNPDLVSYQQLLDIYWVNIDPLDARGQFCDKGDSYRSAIFTLDKTQQQLADASKIKAQLQLASPGDNIKIATKIIDATTFYPAESYHQNYYQTNPVRYKLYRWNCGRNQRLQQLWGSSAH